MTDHLKIPPVDIEYLLYELPRNVYVNEYGAFWCDDDEARVMLNAFSDEVRRKTLEEILQSPELMEKLADIEHDRWSSWMRWMFENYTDENIARWKRQMVTSYFDLPEHSKESDRREVRRTLTAIRNLMNKD